MLNAGVNCQATVPASENAISISGAGPAGLTAAITLARAGAKVIVHERRSSVGERFHSDFQGQENWSSSVDISEDLTRMGVSPDFPRMPFHELIAYDPNGKAYRFSSEQPLFYLVSRGNGPDSLDTALLTQATSLGVEVRFNDPIHHLPEGGICAEGPRAGDVIAAGYLFETDMDDGAYAVLSDDLAPKGYAYLLICKGRATLAICFFADFHNERRYLERAVAFFEDKAGFRLPSNATRFGGLGNVSYPATACKGHILYAGEAAGFQDALWGFGMRYAMTSGHLAARAWLSGKPESYDAMWQQALGARMRAGIVNRLLYSRLGNRGYIRFLNSIAKSSDVRGWLMRYHEERWYGRLLFPWANKALPSKRAENRCVDPACSCTWCRCGKGHTHGYADPRST